MLNNNCGATHRLLRKLERYHFPFIEQDLPKNGIYILFEKGEKAHGGDRIVRVGTHTGNDQLRSRLGQHFVRENKDRSIFRKNIGRCLLNEKNDSFLQFWNIDLTTRSNINKYSKVIDFNKQNSIENEVSNYIQNNMSFVVFEVKDKETRLKLESKIISTVSLCKICKPSSKWLGLSSPNKKITDSGLWLVNELYKTGLNFKDLRNLEEIFKQ